MACLWLLLKVRGVLSAQVDDLDDTSRLEKYIGSSQTIILFLSAGYLGSTARGAAAHRPRRPDRPRVRVF